MLNFFLADRIKETSNTTGTGSFNLDGPVNGFAGFGEFFASGDTVFYAVTDNVDYEVGSGIYEMNGSNRSLSRFVIRSSNMNSGPYYVNGTSTSGPTDEQTGYFHPVWLNKSAALSGVGLTDGPFEVASGFTFSEFPGQTFYYVPEYPGSGEPSHAGLSGVDFNASGAPVNFNAGVKEVFCTYPGKTSVYNGYGLDPRVKEPQRSGIVFWENEQIINYDSDLLWDSDGKVLNIKKDDGVYAVDVGGDIDWSVVRASGFIDGGSGILFSGVAGTFSGGRQLEPFLRNELNNETGSDAVLELSGVVDQGIMLKRQVPRAVFIGPDADCGCPDDYPTFRTLILSDLPSELQDAFNFVRQQDVGIDGESANIAPNSFIPGMVAIYHSSGNVTYDSGIYFDATNDYLMVGGDASVNNPQYAVHAFPDMGADRGYFQQIIFSNDFVRVGSGTGSSVYGNNDGNYFLVNVGSESRTGSGVFEGIGIGHYAALDLNNASGIIAIGTDALSNSHEVEDIIAMGDSAAITNSGSNNLVLLGKNVGISGSGNSSVVAIGKDAARETQIVANSILLGEEVGSGLDVASEFIAIGTKAGYNASGVTNSVAIGKDAVKGSSGILESNLIGDAAASGSFDLGQVNAIGEKVAIEASGLTKSTFIGQAAGRYGETIDNVIAIGASAAQSGLQLERTVAIGGLAASQASGSFNTYIGQDAGIAVSGYENIEIVASGTNESLLGTEASGQLNIGATIVADMYKGRVKVGSPTDTSPDATFEVRPDSADDVGLLLRHVGSGSSQPYFALQSGDATTFYHVTNSGDVITSGCMNPSGGLLLEAITPSQWMNSTTNRLYNDAGTLKWNGSALAVGGGFTSFNFSNNNVDTDAITDGQTLTVSGISGVEVVQDTDNNILQVTAFGLSGTLQDQITAQTYSFFTLNSGDGAQAGTKYEHLSQSVLAMSGVSGVEIDFESQFDGTNSSGLFVIGFNPLTTYTFDAVASGNGADNNNPKTMTDTSVLAVSGISGINIDFINLSDGTNESGVFVFGGTDYWGKASGEWNYSQILENTQSGVAISGIATWASGEVAGFTVLGGTSGITSQNNTYILDPDGSGYLTRLYLDDNEAVVLGSGACEGAEIDEFQSGVFVGHAAGSGMSNTDYFFYRGGSVAIGLGAMKNATDSYSAIAIGNRALDSGVKTDRSIFIGLDAGTDQNNSILGWPAIGNFVSSGTIAIGAEVSKNMNYYDKFSTYIGYQAGAYQGSGEYNVGLGYQSMVSRTDGGSAQYIDSIGIGRRAGYEQTADFVLSNNHPNIADPLAPNRDNIAIGTFSANSASTWQYSVAIGRNAFTQISGVTDSVSIGRETGRGAVYLHSAVMIGYQAGYNASGERDTDTIRHLVAIGNDAGREIFDTDNCIAVGRAAGEQVRSSPHSVLLGSYAGYKINANRNSIIISNRSTQPATRDITFAPSGQPSVLDIGCSIQGGAFSDGGAVHIGQCLNDYDEADKLNYDFDLLLDSALSLTPREPTHAAVKLLHHADSTQTSPLLESMARGSSNPAKWTRNDGSDDYYRYNAIVNEYGFLQIPRATDSQSTGTGSTRILKTSNGDEIPKAIDGTIAIFTDGSDAYLAVAYGGTWRRTALLSTW